MSSFSGRVAADQLATVRKALAKRRDVPIFVGEARVRTMGDVLVCLLPDCFRAMPPAQLLSKQKQIVCIRTVSFVLCARERCPTRRCARV